MNIRRGSGNGKKDSVIFGIMGAAACVTTAFVMPTVISKAAGRIYKLRSKKSKRHSCKKEK